MDYRSPSRSRLRSCVRRPSSRYATLAVLSSVFEFLICERVWTVNQRFSEWRKNRGHFVSRSKTIIPTFSALSLSWHGRLRIVTS